jgi:hypothetical protein
LSKKFKILKINHLKKIYRLFLSLQYKNTVFFINSLLDTPPAPLKRGVCLRGFSKSPSQEGSLFEGLFQVPSQKEVFQVPS